MARGRHRAIPSLVALLAAAVLAGACAARPVSQAVESSGPATASPAGGESAEPPTEAPPSAPVASADASPEPTPAATPGIPQRPGGVSWKEIDRERLGGRERRITHRLTWTAPKGVATRFTVVGVTECLRDEKAFDGKPCLVRGMRIPKGVQEVVAQVPGSARSVDIAWKEGEVGGGPWSAILIRASNDAGDSIFTIAWSATVCWRCTD